MTTIAEYMADSISVSKIKEKLVDFILSKPEGERWKDFYESSTGTLFLELLAVMGSYIGYQSLISRRESYQWDAKIRSSSVAIAETFGYPVYRGKNEHLVLTIKPTETITLSKFSLVGQCLDKDLVCIEPLNLIYDEEISFEVAIGTLKETSLEVSTTNPKNFRFDVPSVSEDFILFLNGTELPVSTRILNLINDYYVVLTNSVGSLDVLYLNRQPPESWFSNTLYSNGQYISPDFSWRGETEYSLGDRVEPIDSNGFYYEVTQAGTSSDSEPTWPIEKDVIVSDNTIEWKCLGSTPERLYFKSGSIGTAYSGATEPIWPMELGETVDDNEVEWICIRDYTYSLYPYQIGDTLSVKYIELAEVVHTEQDLDLYYGALISSTLENSYSGPESIDDIKINSSLYHETERVVKGRNDYKKIFRQLLPNSVDTNGHDVSPAVVELSYVKDHTTELWLPGIYKSIGDIIMPSLPNNKLYQAITSGYTSSDTNGISADTEPIWPTSVGSTIKDGQIVWECKGTFTSQTTWEADTIYNINDAVAPTVSNGYYYMPLKFEIEPEWPLEVDYEVVDNEVTWKCIDDIFLKGYESSTWEVNTNVSEGDFIIPIVPKNYFYQALNEGLTGSEEPVWPTVLGETVIDNEVVWACYDLMDAEKYQKNRTLEALVSYRTFGVEPPTIKDPEIVYVKLSITVTLNSSNILLSTILDDVDTILEDKERKLYEDMTIEDIEYDLERLSYVKIARVIVTSETKSDVWASYKLYGLRDVVRPTTENGYYYESYYNRNAAEYGYSQGTEIVYSQGSEPVWPTTLGETVSGGNGQITWECVDEPVEVVDTWDRNTAYELNQVILPTVSTGYAYKVSNIAGTEPVWPTNVGESIIDGEVYWVCKDPSQSPPNCDWRQYYIIGREVTLA